MSTELQQIRSQMRHDRILMRAVMSAFLLYAVACAGVTMLQLAQL